MNRVPEDNRAAGGPAPRSVRGALLPLVLAGCCLSIQPPLPSLQASESVLEAHARSDAGGRLNVLFLCVDDLRPELGCYGTPGMVTPHIDQLARQGVRFTRAYCQFATCGPSRVALLTGLRPETTGAVQQWSDYRREIPEVIAMPELFKRAGWTTRALGKIHHGHGEIDDEQSWSEPCWRPSRWQRYYALPESQEAVEKVTETWTRKDAPPRVLAWEAPDVPASELPDAMIADEAIRFLRGPHEQPFFLAVGFLKPHMPFVAPKKFWDLYPEESVVFSDAPDFPIGAPEIASSSSSEIFGFLSIREQGAGEDVQRALIRGYRACVSHVDAQIGRVMAALDDADLRDSTVVVLWGDHGWHLGDQGLWGKHTNYEAATITPLVVLVPGMDCAGRVSSGMVESVDLYPTLARICGLEVPEVLEGISFEPLLEDPERPWKRAVFSEYHRKHPEFGVIPGRSIRTRNYRFVDWALPESDFREHELYDLSDDRTERKNLAADPEHAELLLQLQNQLRAGWRAALPQEELGVEAESPGEKSRGDH